jgi:hypothetical protein
MDDIERPKETPEQRATRMWGNNDLTKRFLEEKHKPPTQPAKKIIEVFSTERPKAEETTKFERKFIKDRALCLRVIPTGICWNISAPYEPESIA